MLSLGVVLRMLHSQIPLIQFRGTGGTNQARYCYSVWLRHLVLKNQYVPSLPKTLAELGPGDSLGIGLAALLSGVEKYYAFDVVEHAAAKKNIEIFDELVELFRRKEAIPGDDEFPQLFPKLKDYAFPHQLIRENALDSARLNRIRDCLRLPTVKREDAELRYVVPWDSVNELRPNSVDMILSQAVLEHVEDVQGVYQTLKLWLKDDGVMTHQIDFKSHGSSRVWNGHWTYGDRMWRIIKGRKKYLINRHPCSVHLDLIAKLKIKTLHEQKIQSSNQLKRGWLAPAYKNLNENDLTCSGYYFLGVKDS